jgi:hypothetical protein
MITLTKEEAQQVLLVLEYPGPSWADSRAEVAATLRTRLALHDMNKAAEQNGEEL